MICVDGTELTVEKLREAEERLKSYRENVVKGDVADDFLESHLVVLETGIQELYKRLEQSDRRLSRTTGGMYEYTLQAVVMRIENEIQEIMEQVKEKGDV